MCVWAHLVLEASNRKTKRLVEAVLGDTSVAVVEVPDPCVGPAVLRRTPEVGVVLQIVEITVVVAVTGAKSCINNHCICHLSGPKPNK